MIKKIFLFIFMFFMTYNISLASSYVYFYWQWCSHCAKVADYMEKNDIQEKFDVEKHEVYYDDENRKMFLEYWKKLWINENKLWVPFMVITDENNYVSWDKNIINYFDDKLWKNQKEEAEENTNQDLTEYQEDKSFWSFLFILLPAALADSINPCVFAVMLILLGSILNRYKSYKKMILSWCLFILAIFISYYLMGLWIYKVISFSSSLFYVKLWVWILWLLVWLANLKDFFWYGKWFIMEVPPSWRPKMAKLIKEVTSPTWAFVIWFVVSLFLLPCTSWPYLTILWYLASESSTINMMWYIYLLIYNLIFILPMVVIIVLVAVWAKTIWELKEYKEYYVREIHLVVAILMLLLSGYIFYDLFF